MTDTRPVHLRVAPDLLPTLATIAGNEMRRAQKAGRAARLLFCHWRDLLIDVQHAAVNRGLNIPVERIPE